MDYDHNPLDPTLEADSIDLEIELCPTCGVQAEVRKCKLVCPRCGTILLNCNGD